MDTKIELPDWLEVADEAKDLPKYPRSKDDREIQESTFNAVFERVIEGVEAGRLATHIVREDPRNIDFSRFMSWVRRNPERLKRFEAAKENGMMIIEDMLIDIAAGDPDKPPEDVQRSKLRVDTLWKIMQAWNRKRYGNDNSNAGSQFAGGVTIVIGEVQSPYAQRDPLTIEHK